jgi:hypothetical protein
MSYIAVRASSARAREATNPSFRQPGHVTLAAAIGRVFDVVLPCCHEDAGEPVPFREPRRPKIVAGTDSEPQSNVRDGQARGAHPRTKLSRPENDF